VLYSTHIRAEMGFVLNPRPRSSLALRVLNKKDTDLADDLCRTSSVACTVALLSVLLTACHRSVTTFQLMTTGRQTRTT